MTLQSRVLLLVTSLLVIAVVGTAAMLTWSTRQALLEQTEADGEVIAGLLARSAGFAEEIPEEVEDAIGDQMIAGATITAHLVSVAEAAGLSTDEITVMLQDIADRTVLDEFWITDESGYAYLRTEQGVEFTFSPDAEEQPQASAFWPLLTGEEMTVVQEAQRREIDEGIFKYVGVAGVDQPRIVELGTSADLLDQLAADMGPAHLADDIVAGGNVQAITIVDRDLEPIAYSVSPGSVVEASGDWDQADQDLGHVVAEGETLSRRGDDALHVASPIFDPSGQVIGAVLVSLPTTGVQEALRENLAASALVAVSVVLIGVLSSVAIARWVTKPVAQLTAAAAAVEAGEFESDSVEAVARRNDGLGQLARVFQNMAHEVEAREQRLKTQVQELKIEIDRTKEAQQVAEITETDYFQDLQAKARALRARPAPGGTGD